MLEPHITAPLPAAQWPAPGASQHHSARLKLPPGWAGVPAADMSLTSSDWAQSKPVGRLRSLEPDGPRGFVTVLWRSQRNGWSKESGDRRGHRDTNCGYQIEREPNTLWEEEGEFKRFTWSRIHHRTVLNVTKWRKWNGFFTHIQHELLLPPWSPAVDLFLMLSDRVRPCTDNNLHECYTQSESETCVSSWYSCAYTVPDRTFYCCGTHWYIQWYFEDHNLNEFKIWMRVRLE